ncbi:MAG: glycosyltransferase [Verrucomicrobiales bacterium]
MPRVAICFWRLGPYHHARLEAAARLMEVEAIEFVGHDDVYSWDLVDGARGFRRSTLQATYDGSRSARRRAVEKMDATLSRVRPDVVAIPGWALPDALMALIWCRRHRTPAVLMSESTAWDSPRHPLKECLKRRVVGQCSAALVGGSSHVEYAVDLGMPRDAVWSGYDVVDNAHFAQGAEAARTSAPAHRQRLGLDRPYFLASARFLPQKNLMGLMEAFALSLGCDAEHDHGWDLVILGNGPLRGALEARRGELALIGRVHMPGFVQFPELPTYYGLASAFVHVSTMEPWGLVVNEAMASGLPVVVSRRCGCAADLVRDGQNGFTVDPGNLPAMADLLREMTKATFPLLAMAEASCRLIRDWSPSRFAEGLRHAADHAMNRGPRANRTIDTLILQCLLRRSSNQGASPKADS